MEDAPPELQHQTIVARGRYRAEPDSGWTEFECATDAPIGVLMDVEATWWVDGVPTDDHGALELRITRRLDTLFDGLDVDAFTPDACGRAMLAKPRVLMLDEPSLGLSPLFVAKVFELIQEMNRSGLTIVLVEQNTGKALSVAHSATVLELGKVVVAGPSEALRHDHRLLEAYLGGSAETPDAPQPLRASSH